MATYGNKASDKVEKAMHERKHGTLKSGGSGKKVTSRKQAIAIGLSEARREGGKVPPARSGGARKSAAKKANGRNTAARKAGATKAAPRKTSARKSTARKTGARKTARKSAAKKSS
jgi:hypothetical protein